MPHPIMTRRARAHLTRLREHEYTWEDIGTAVGATGVYMSSVHRGVHEPSIGVAVKILAVDADAVTRTSTPKLAGRIRDEYAAFRNQGYSHQWTFDRLLDAYDINEKHLWRIIDRAGLAEEVEADGPRS